MTVLATCSVLSAAVIAVTLIALPRLHPRIAAIALLLGSLAAATAGLWALSVPTFAYLFHSTSDGLAGWCRSLLGNSQVPSWLGLPSAILLATILLRLVRRWRVLHRSSRHIPVGERITIVDQDEPLAMTTSGRTGRIIVSTGMLDALTPLEQRSVFAHELTHLDHRHDRYLLWSELAAIANPLVAPLNRLLRRSLERWADENAAEAVGDRTVVARALEIAARSTLGLPTLGSGMGHSEVLARLDALDLPAPRGHHSVAGEALIVVGLATAAVNVVGTGLQFHQLLELLVHVCPF